MHALYSNLLKNPAQLLCAAQARRQGLAAGGPKTRRGGHIFKIHYWIHVATGGPNVKWGHRFQMGWPGTTGPPLATALGAAANK